MTNIKNKKNVIFDLGNVVIDIDLSITLKRFGKLGFKQEGNFLNKFKQSGIFSEFEEGKISGDGFINGIKDQMNANVSYQEVSDAWDALMGDYKQDRIETILKLKQTHQVILLSNTNVIHIEGCKNRVPLVGSLDKLFNRLYYSYEMGMSKPSAQIFEAVLNDANINAEETLFLDDGPANIKVAQSLGIESWLVEFPDQWVPKMNELLNR